MSLFQHPLSRFLAVYMLGLCLAEAWPFPFRYPSLRALCTGLILLSLAYWLLRGRALMQALLLLAVVFLLALLRWGQVQEKPLHLPKVGKRSLCVLEVLEEGRWRADTWRGRVRCRSRPQLLEGDQAFHLWLQYSPPQRPADWSAGQVLLGQVNFEALPEPASPHHFDYGAFLHRQGLWRTGRAQRLYPIDDLGGLWYGLDSWRQKARQYLLQWPLHYDNRQLLVALLLGDRSGLDPALIQDYQATGTMHLLAISGMHVGLWFAVLSFCFQQLGRFWPRPWPHYWLSVALLWGYAIFTGASVSVCRATALISLWVLNQQRGRQTPFWHQLLLVAALFLLWNPQQLFDLGFQLSFLAVAGILLFYPIFPALWPKGPFWWQGLWSGARLSIAAQAGVFPVLLVNFHQFPWHFVLTNALALPMLLPCLLLSLLLALLQGALALGSWSVPLVLYQILDLWMRAQGFLIAYFSSWRQWLWRDLYVDNFQLVCLALLLVALALFLRLALKGALYLGLLAAVCLCADQAWEARTNLNQGYKARHTAYPQGWMEIRGRQALLLAAPKDTAALLWHYRPFWAAHNVHRWHYFDPDRGE